MALVSIVTCTYNRAHLIGETIRSVLQQTLQDFEYIIVDDGSTDNTEDVVQTFKESRISYFKHDRTGGHLSRLRNYAHTKCHGEFIAYIDSDDIWAPDKLTLQIKALRENPSSGFSFTDIEIFNKAGTIRSSIYNQSGLFIGSVFNLMLSNKLIICHTTLVLKKSSLETTGPMDETMHSGDHDLVFFLSRLFDACVFYQPLVHVRKHDQNSTSSNELSLRLLKEHHRTLQKFLDKKMISNKEYNKAMSITSYSFGIQALSSNAPKAAVHYFSTCLKITPWNLKAWLRLFQTLSKQVFSR